MNIIRLPQGGGSVEIGDITTKDMSNNDDFVLCDGSKIAITDNEYYPKCMVASLTEWTASSQIGGKMVYGNGVWVLVGSGDYLLTSTDNGETWTTRDSSLPGGYDRAIAYGNGLWVAINNDGQIATSVDGITWILSSSSLDAYCNTCLTYDNGLWVAAGYIGKLATSTDGITWTPRESSFSGTILTLAYGNGLWCIGGYYGQLATSPDTITWTLRESNFGSSDIKSLAYGNGLWVATGYYLENSSNSKYGKVATSTDGITWTLRESAFAVNYWKYETVCNADGLWIIGGSGSGYAKIQTSIDGITWTLSPMSSESYNGVIIDIYYGNGKCFLRHVTSNSFKSNDMVVQLPAYTKPAYLRIK